MARIHIISEFVNTIIEGVAVGNETTQGFEFLNEDKNVIAFVSFPCVYYVITEED